MSEVHISLKSKEQAKEKFIFGIKLDIFFSAIMIPVAALIVSSVIRNQEVDAKNFELAIKILESDKYSDPEIKKWAKQTFVEYARVAPSKEALVSLDEKPFIYDRLKIEKDKPSFYIGGSIGNFNLSGTNDNDVSIIINRIDLMNGAGSICYSHMVEHKKYTSHTSFNLGYLDKDKVKNCFSSALGDGDVLDVFPVEGNSSDEMRSSYDFVEVVNLQVSWSPVYEDFSNEKNKYPVFGVDSKSFYLVARKK